MTFQWKREFAGAYYAQKNLPNKDTNHEWVSLGVWRCGDKPKYWRWRATLNHCHGDISHSVEWKGVACSLRSAKEWAETHVPYLVRSMRELHQPFGHADRIAEVKS